MQYGRMFSQCYLFDYAAQIYQKANELSQNIENQDLRLLITAEIAINYFQNGNITAGHPMMASIKSGLEWAKEPETLTMVHLALAYDASNVSKSASIMDSELGQAFAEAGRASLNQRLGDCFYAKAVCMLARGKPADAIDAARNALQSYTRAQDFLSQSLAHAFMSNYYRTQKNDAAADIENQKALDTMDDFSKGPMIDPERIFRMAPQLQTDHINAAKHGDYQKAANQVISLLILSRYRAKIKNQDSPILTSLHDGELQAYLACYAIRQGDAWPARILLAMSDKTMKDDLNPINRARHRFLSGKILRLAGSSSAALELLDKADQTLAQFDNPDPALTEEVMEERGLTLLELGRREEAQTAFQDALKFSQKANFTEEATRLQRYLKGLADGKTNLESLASPPPPTATPKPIVRKTASSDLFDSPFADETGATPSADAVMKLEMTRLNPTPTPINLSPELLMGSQLYDQAARKLQSILKAEGESPERLMQLGICYFNLHEWTKAQDAFQRVLKLDSNNGPAQEYLKGVSRHLAPQPSPTM